MTPKEWIVQVMKDVVRGIEGNQFAVLDTKNHKKAAVLLRVMELMYMNLTQNVVSTKRDLFYQDVKLFKQQSVVDSAVDEIAALYGGPRELFNVVAAPRALGCCLQLKIKYPDKVFEITNPQPFLIPNIHNGTIKLDAEFVLIVEKDATFEYLLQKKYVEKTNCLLVTGKGYPDLNLRNFLKQIPLKMYAIVDYDPYGIHIYLIYSECLKIEHKGVYLEDPIPLTYQDRKKAHFLLKQKPKKEVSLLLQRMLMLGYKSEIQNQKLNFI